MIPDVVVDIGNTRMKWGRVVDGRVADVARLRHDDPVGWKRQLEAWALVAADSRWAVAGVVPAAAARCGEWLASRGANPVSITTTGLYRRHRRLQFRTAVARPARLGIDRFCNALAAHRSAPAGASAVAISVGTAMTVDFVEPDGTHVGGAILPGPRLMARSLKRRTAALPRVQLVPEIPRRIWGCDTKEAIALGVASAILGAVDQLVWDWAARSPRPAVFVTGGDAGYFRGFVLTADVTHYVLDPLLTLEGIRLAAEALP